MTATEKQLFYRLIALWAVCEGVLGGLIHSIQIPITGLTIGSCAVILISLIAYYVPKKGAILQATICVCVFKMMLSPQSPLPAYFAVMFQGLVGELFFFNRKYFKYACVFFAMIALLESATQRIVVVTVLYGTEFWKAVNDFIIGLTGKSSLSNVSYYLAGVYIIIHLLTGIFLGIFISKLPAFIQKWQTEEKFVLPDLKRNGFETQKSLRRKRGMKGSLFFIWICLLALYLQSVLHLGNPILNADETFTMLVRACIIIFSWYFLVSPLLRLLLKRWLEKKKKQQNNTIQEILLFIPSTQKLLEQAWQYSATLKGYERLKFFMKITLVHTLDNKYDPA